MSGSMGPFFPACPWAPLQCVRSEGKQMFLTHKCPTYDKLQLSLQTVQQIAMCFTLLPPSLSLSLSLSLSSSRNENTSRHGNVGEVQSAEAGVPVLPCWYVMSSS